MQISVKELVELMASVNRTTTTEISCIKESTTEISHESDTTIPVSDYICKGIDIYAGGSIDKNVKRLRTKMGMTQQALAEKVGVNHTMIGHIENGTKIPSLAVALDLARVLGCTVEEMCNRTFTKDVQVEKEG